MSLLLQEHNYNVLIKGANMETCHCRIANMGGLVKKWWGRNGCRSTHTFQPAMKIVR